MSITESLKKKSFNLILAVLLAFTLVPNILAGELQVRVKVRRANVRAEPNLKSEIVGKVNQDAVLESDGKEREWYQVRLPLKLEGYTLPGYMHESTVEEAEEGTPVLSIGEPVMKGPGFSMNIQPGAGIIAGYVAPSEKNYGSAFAIGGSLVLQFSEKITLELRGFTFQSQVEGNPEGLSKGNLLITPLQLSVLGLFPLNSQWVTFIGAGVGYYWNRFTLDSEVIKTWQGFRIDVEESVKNSLGFHIGGGINFHVSEKIALFSDLRYCFVKSSGEWLQRDTVSGVEATGELDKMSLNFLMLGVGFKFLF